MAYKIFISHSSVDTWVARQIKEKIERCGADTFFDAFDIKVGDNFEGKIKQGIQESDELLVLFTARALKSEYVIGEIAMAFQQGLTVSPVLYDVDEKRIRDKPFINKTKFININDLDTYFSELKEKVSKLKNSGL